MARDVSDGPKAVLDVDVLFRRHAARVYRMVASLVGPGASDEDVEDLTQEVFLTAHRALPRFRGESKVETWLYGIASRVVLTNLRSWRRHRRLKRALEAEPTQAVGPDIERSAVHRQELWRVWRCLMGIKPDKRIVYLMYEVEGMSGKEIADALRIKEATVRTRLFHARRELAEALKRKEGA